MDIKWALNQSVGWKAATGEYDAYAQPLYKPVQAIPARIVRKMKLIRNPDGAEAVSATQCFVLEPVNIGDVIVIDDAEHSVIAEGGGLGLYSAAESFRHVYL